MRCRSPVFINCSSGSGESGAWKLCLRSGVGGAEWVREDGAPVYLAQPGRLVTRSALCAASQLTAMRMSQSDILILKRGWPVPILNALSRAGKWGKT